MTQQGAFVKGLSSQGLWKTGKEQRNEGRRVDLKRILNDSWKSMKWIKHWWVVNMEKSGLSGCMPIPACLRMCVHVHTWIRMCMYVHATEGSAVCSTGWQGGCQNGLVSCVGSKIGPNTAEMHDTLWLFTALTQYVRRMLPNV